MNCRSAQPLLSAERDGALAFRERADLEAHVAGCAECRRFQATLAATGEQLRAAAARVVVPDEVRAWQDIQREIRLSKPEAARPWWNVVRWAVPLTGVAALAMVAFISPDLTDDDDAMPTVARAEYVEVGGDASSMVYVDDKSGWLVVWAEPAGKSG
jgi:predicted anti-sigma-YlaC factor YlaD